MPTDETRTDIPLPTEASTPGPTTDHAADRQPVELHPAHPASSRRALAIVVVALAAILTFLGARTIADLDDASPVSDDAAEVLDDAAGASPDTSVPAPEAPVGQPANEPAGQDGPQQAPKGGDEPQGDDGDAADPEATHPCDSLPEGRFLAITPSPASLPVGQYAGELIITNCADEATPWSAQTLAPNVQFGVNGGVLAAGAEVDLQFAVDPSDIVGASYIFTINVNEPGHATPVQVTVSKPMLNPAIPQPPSDQLQLGN